MSQTLRTFSGSLVALATPFGPDGQVDYKQLEALVEFQLEHHTDGIVALGTTAETPTLSQEEKDKIAQTVIGKVAGRIPVIVGAGSNDTLHAAALARRYEAMGADGLLVVTPYYNKANKSGMLAHFRTIADGVNIPILLYNVPSRTGCSIPLDVLEELSHHKNIVGIKEASGDIAYVSKKIRARLDEEGLTDCKIVVSNSMDEVLIRDLIMQGAQIDTFGIGERLITSRSAPIFGGVYKLAAIEDKEGHIIPKIKISENVEKITTPHFKQVWRFYDKETGLASADVVALHEEEMPQGEPYTIFDPTYTWKKKTLTDYTVVPLLQPIFQKGKCVYEKRPIQEIQAFCRQQVGTLWPEVKRFENPHSYIVDLSPKLWKIKQDLLEQY